MRAVQLSSRAEADIEAIADFIGRDNPVRARTFVAELRAKCMSLGEHSFRGRVVPVLSRDARSLVFRRYIILYRVLDRIVAIERIVHGARDMQAALDDDAP